MKLNSLLHVLHCTLELPDIDVKGLKLDSRKVAVGDAFIAVPGHDVDGRDFISGAVAAGAIVVLAEGSNWGIENIESVPMIHIPDLSKHLSKLASHFYGYPSQGMDVYGVTGTNGKTTVSHLLAQLFDRVTPPTAVIGTVGSGMIKALIPETLTTPDPVTLQQRLASLRAEGAACVCIEVSSHALAQGRVEGIQFAGVVATNLSRDHLDYHGTMEAYESAKKRLFTEFHSPIQVVNLDDVIIREWRQQDTIGFSLNDEWLGNPNTLVATDIEFTHEGSRFTLNWENESVRTHTQLLGEFNIANILGACATALAKGMSLAELGALIGELTAVPGRMETFKLQNGALAIVDYAHTPDALDHVLQAARRHCKGELWCLFGCGGDRDRGKRPQMGQVAAQFADRIVITDDNPRTEDPQQIINDIVSGMPGGIAYEATEGRANAVRQTLAKLKPNDVAVLAGKGHETYQVIGTRRTDYDERTYVTQLIEESAHD
ncbi:MULTISPECIES: UDP-N-acetylmuramoyl-L-alanyl-D-glutamate--2,6-diaminopimelate ligase [Gammaproteobacteria]|uniref:UDP-N-acetylmuramoyl-L-alanyl-D-glutamate--2, 6-diaminopimelate ligase n=1 Tax=Gammaproteobacteria TaxID=1236 RepID=UPI000DCF85EB|nr:MULTISPECIES: UDP-N-acetylmuramoyl-L-alanyl-D-glutamate--2,6-diaminopimelate ligase [Gammaproteobacteria]RTE86322.1 UDP-N-acetylmuramoyl-L-alanyl-D-glutamate--2,6-diaminopimelate ligase [Aliidiomarina sp. B3213]TCZ91672.1 UDP-N-acetylmuramoyl-L-alanyl-D-glutamate--2,6-diaminopimelate ligase [Lysobacter sp. N42]